MDRVKGESESGVKDCGLRTRFFGFLRIEGIGGRGREGSARVCVS